MHASSAPAAPTRSAPRHEPAPPGGVAQPAASTLVICDLADAPAFAETPCQPHAPILTAFGTGRLHRYVDRGSWDLPRAVADAPEALFRSINVPNHDERERDWTDLTFRYGPHAFVCVQAARQIVGFADTPDAARSLVVEFDARYARPPAPKKKGGRFHLIRVGNREIDTEPVTLGTETVLDPNTFHLHYGAEGWAWHEGFVTRLNATHRGMCILEGSPGTGKTSYLRHLMGVLQESHRFYFIPPATLDVLSDPGFIGFWAGQRRRDEDRQFVVILEDADTALMRRAADNRSQVSALLNLSDGMLGDFLSLQILCTINCRASDIDPALLRPGRLLCHRLFDRLDRDGARRLAGHLGRRLPPEGGEFSLAEVYAAGDEPQTFPSLPRLGFAA